MGERVLEFDVVVVGGGIAGVSLGYELAQDRSVCVLEQESTLAFHTTGRSAALFLESYGNETIRALTSASRAFLEDPPEHWDSRLLTPRSLLQFAARGRGAALEAMYARVRQLTPDVELVTPDDARALFPLLRSERIDMALYEPGSMEVDVHALHQGYVRGLRARDGTVAASAGVTSLRRVDRMWRIESADGIPRRAPVVVDAAGAWADRLAELAGAARMGLRPLRRTVFMIGSPDTAETAGTAHLPTLSDIDESFYLKPEGDQMLCSPADETPTEPSDVRPDEMEIARAFDAIHETTTLTTRHVRSSWAGLRSFVADRTPVVGFDPQFDGFFWCAGQGGYGIQTCAALARVGAALLRGEEIPDDVRERGLSAADLAPGRTMPHIVNG
ncbi:MAG: FAD-binding oxidoreductase [Rhodococcus sp. (in: high G+C Gram-positive bacteria)]